MYLVGYLKNKK